MTELQVLYGRDKALFLMLFLRIDHRAVLRISLKLETTPVQTCAFLLPTASSHLGVGAEKQMVKLVKSKEYIEKL